MILFGKNRASIKLINRQIGKRRNLIEVDIEYRKTLGIKSLIAVLAIAMLLVFSGWLSADWLASNADEEIRNSLLFQAKQISRAIDPELVKRLTFTEADQGSPAFEQIREQLVSYGKLFSQRGIYSMIMRDGALVFGPENYDHDDPMASLPGTIYERPSPENYDIFSTMKPVAMGPVTDEYGTFISALAPVYDPRTGEVLMVIGIDFLSDSWQEAIRKARQGPLAITILLVLLLLAGTWAVYWRNQQPETHFFLFRHIETISVGMIGLIVTTAATFLVFEAENREQSQIFIRSSYAMAEAVDDTFRDIKNNVAAIVRFNEGSIHVDMNEFIVFVEPMTRNSAIQGYLLVSFVPATDKISFETIINSDGIEDYFIWERNSKGKPIPVTERSVYYPVCYVAPWKDNQGNMGFDLGSEPYLLEVLEQTIQTGLVMATEPFSLVQDNNDETEMFILQPIYSNNNRFALNQSDFGSDRPVRGFAIGVIRLGSILDVILKKYLDERFFVDLHLVDAGSGILMASYPDRIHKDHPRTVDKNYLQKYRHALTYPVFVFGRPLAIASLPTFDFYDLHPLRESRMVCFAGLLLTIVLTFSTGFWRNRHMDLEFQVRTRTSALRESESRFRALFENAINGVALHKIVLDKNGKPVDYIFLQVNPGFEKHTGLKVENIQGRCATDIFAGITKAPFIEVYGDVALKGQPVTFEAYFEPLQRHHIINAYQVGKGQFATIILDITEQKKSEEEKNKLQDQLAQAQKMEAVGRLAGGVAHDFNNMLSVIIGYAEIVSEKLTTSNPIQKDLEEIITAAKRSTDLVGQLMAFARKQHARPVILNLNDIISSLFNMLRRLIGENIELVWVPEQGLWDVKIDPSQIDQLLANLMVNARDAIEGHGKVTIETQNKLLEEKYFKDHSGSISGEYVLLAVTDNGCGMDKETLENVFEPFFTTKEMGKGTGLGLSTVFGIIKQNNGFIDVHSEPGTGTTFKVYLPRFEDGSITGNSLKNAPATSHDKKVR